MEERSATSTPGVTTTLRVDAPGGEVLEIVRTDEGRISATHRSADGSQVETVVAELAPSGAFTVDRYDGSGSSLGAVEPVAVDRRINVYGATVEHAVYDGGLVVERSFDDDTVLREVTVRGPWGSQTVALRPDGGRTMRWETPLHHGSQTWDASGDRVEYEVVCTDGSSYRFGVIDGVGRETIIGRRGEVRVVEHRGDAAG